MIRPILRAISIFLPWALRRRVLSAWLGYRLHPSSRIGFSWVFPEQLVLGDGARIGHLTVCRNLELLHLHREATIGHANWITAHPRGGPEPWLYSDQPERKIRLVLEHGAAISTRHFLDCTDEIRLRPYAAIGGVRSVLLTHGPDLAGAKLECGPIEIGDYSFVSTNCVIIAGSRLPRYCLLGAASLLRDHFDQDSRLYAGSPAVAVKELDREAAWFVRDHPRAR